MTEELKSAKATVDRADSEQLPSDSPGGGLSLIPIHRDPANDWIRKVHRHHKPTLGYKFALAAELSGELVGVAVVGRPVSRHQDDGRTLEVTRLATNGTRNACSFLYGACRRAVRALGYARTITYTLATESGSSLRAAGFRLVHETRAEAWDRPSRPRQTGLFPETAKLLWEAA